MKLKNFFWGSLLLLGALSFFAFAPVNDGTTYDLSDNSALYKEGKSINLEESYVQYTGYKNVGKSHTGKLFFESGSLEMEREELASGEFSVAMNSITNEDIGAAFRGKFIKHMKSADFFDVDTYPSAKFKITSVTENAENGYSHTITGSLTLKGETRQISMPATVTTDNGRVTIQGQTKVDRTEFGIKYGSGNYFKDLTANKVIKDKFLMEVFIIT